MLKCLYTVRNRIMELICEDNIFTMKVFFAVVLSDVLPYFTRT